jgi:hypothetical protein
MGDGVCVGDPSELEYRISKLQTHKVLKNEFFASSPNRLSYPTRTLEFITGKGPCCLAAPQRHRAANAAERGVLQLRIKS